MGNIEFEGRILEIEVNSIIKKLLALGAEHQANLKFRRYVFDTIPLQKGKWIRLRTDGQKTTLAVKHILNDDIDGTKEWEVEVSDFDETFLILKESGINYRSYQENIRSVYTLHSAEIVIDEWPKIPPYLEIEAATKKQIISIAKQLGYAESDITGINNDKIYLKYGINIDTIRNLKF